MYQGTGGAELTRVLVLCGSSVVRASACAFEKLNPNPTIALIGFPFQFGILQMCATFY